MATTTSDMRGKVLFDGLVAAVWAMCGKNAPAKRGLVLALSRDEAAEAVTLPTKATGADLVALVESRGASPFRLLLGP